MSFIFYFFLNIWDNSESTDFPELINFEVFNGTNYSIACSNSTTIFDTPLNLQNCLTLGITAALLESGAINLNNSQSARSNLHVDDLHAFNSSAVLDDITLCLSSTCQNTGSGACAATVSGNLTEAYNTHNNITEKLQKLYTGICGYCDNLGAQLNSDVVGPGVRFWPNAVTIIFCANKCPRSRSHICFKL